MAVIATVLAAMAPTLKGIALQTAINVGVDQASKYIGGKNAETAGQAVQAFAGGDIDGLVDIGTNFVTDFAGRSDFGPIGNIASEGVQQILGAGQGNYGQAMQDFGVDQSTQFLNQIISRADLSQFPNLQRLSQTPEGLSMMSQAFGTMQQQGGMAGLTGSMAGLAGNIGSMWHEATRPPAHQDPNNNPELAGWRQPQHKESLLQNMFGRPAPAPTASINMQNQPLITPNPQWEGSPLINNGRYQVR